MTQLNRLVKKAEKSPFYLWLLNVVLLRTVPFNAPHRIKIKRIDHEGIMVYAPKRRSNQNHIHGLHACLLATLCEYASGLSLLLHISPDEYRIILKNIHMTYHYQAKTAVTVRFQLSKEQVEQSILPQLASQESIFQEFTVEVYDLHNNHICTGLINWQIKAWKNVKLKAA